MTIGRVAFAVRTAGRRQDRGAGVPGDGFSRRAMAAT